MASMKQRPSRRHQMSEVEVFKIRLINWLSLLAFTLFVVRYASEQIESFLHFLGR